MQQYIFHIFSTVAQPYLYYGVHTIIMLIIAFTYFL